MQDCHCGHPLKLQVHRPWKPATPGNRQPQSHMQVGPPPLRPLLPAPCPSLRHLPYPLDPSRPLQAQHAELSVIDFVATDPKINSIKTKPEMSAVLSTVGFTTEMQEGQITAISGGWKMKLSLARAMLIGADILLLDEPTNHLDTTNVAWLENYLVSQTQITSMIVSHDSGFLDHVCTDIIHYKSRRLRRYRGNLSEFVKQVPAARSYYELEAATLKFRFPTPGEWWGGGRPRHLG